MVEVGKIEMKINLKNILRDICRFDFDKYVREYRRTAVICNNSGLQLYNIRVAFFNALYNGDTLDEAIRELSSYRVSYREYLIKLEVKRYKVK